MRKLRNLGYLFAQGYTTNELENQCLGNTEDGGLPSVLGFMNVFRILFFLFFFFFKNVLVGSLWPVALPSLLHHFCSSPCLQRNHKFQTLFWPFCIIGVNWTDRNPCLCGPYINWIQSLILGNLVIPGLLDDRRYLKEVANKKLSNLENICTRVIKQCLESIVD